MTATESVSGLAGTSVGLIGIGRMGSGLGECLLRHGAAVRIPGYRSAVGAAALAALGADLCPNARSVVAGIRWLVLCLGSAEDVGEVLVGPEGVLQALPEGTGIIDCTTSLPHVTVKLAALARQCGLTYVDAPLLRTPVEARQGRLVGLVGGETDDVRSATCVLSAFCEDILHVGACSAGHRMKLLNNCLSLGMAALAAEVVCAAEALGTDLRDLQLAVARGSGNSIPFQAMASWALEPDPDRLAFSMAHALKDLQYALRTIPMEHDALPLVCAAAAAFARVLEDGGGSRTLPHYLTALRQRRDTEARRGPAGDITTDPPASRGLA